MYNYRKPRSPLQKWSFGRWMLKGFLMGSIARIQGLVSDPWVTSQERKDLERVGRIMGGVLDRWERRQRESRRVAARRGK